MQNNSTIATHKIILFVVFVCAAMMTSLFIFHLRQKPQPSPLSPDEGILFPVARDINPFELVSTYQKKFSRADFLNHWTLLFFGFTHCSSTCPTTLSMLSQAYKDLQPTYPNLQIVLVSLDPERDTPATLASYTAAFHPDFIGVSGKLQEVRKLQSQLGVFSARDTTPGANDQLQHTATIMLINPKGQWAGMFKFGMNKTQLANAFITSVHFLSHA